MAVSVQAAERRIEKSAQAFRTISEVASELDVPQHVLRFWESKFSQVRPLKRGGGRRYYRPEDVDLLRRIRTLLYEDGYTIKGVQRLLKEGRGRLPQQRLDMAAESALESLRIVSARAEAMAGGGARQPLPRTGPSSRCRLQLTIQMRLPRPDRPAREMAPRVSGSSHSPSPRKLNTRLSDVSSIRRFWTYLLKRAW